MLTRWKTLSSRIVRKNPWWTYKVDEYEIPARTKGEYHFVHTEGASMVIPVLGDGRLVLVNQFRYLCNRESIEFPCGGVKPGKSYEEMARLELEEETGYRSNDLQKAGEFDPYNGVTDEFCALFIARDLVQSIPHPDITEEFEMITCTTGELETMIRNGTIWDGMTLAAWALAKHKVIS